MGGRCALGCTSLYHSAIFERAHPDENAEKTPPKRRAFSCRGIHALPAPVKAHTAPHVGKHGLQLRHETFGLQLRLYLLAILVECHAFTLLAVFVHLLKNYLFLNLR